MSNMFRYLYKYIGKYKVLAPKDLETNEFPKNELGEIDESFDDLYIPCKKGVIKHTYKDDILCWYCDKISTVMSVERNIRKKFPSLEYEIELTDFEGLIYFRDEDFEDKIAKIVHPEKEKLRLDPYTNKIIELPKKRRRRSSKNDSSK